MSIISDIFSGGAEGVLKGVGGLAKDIRTAITGDEPLSADQKLKLSEMASALEVAALAADVEVVKGQTAINMEEAKSDSLFKSGWRPAVGWVCVAGLLFTFVIKPLLPWSVQVSCLLFGYVSALPPMPDIPMGDLITLLVGMLGLGGMRTFEKLRGVAAK